MSGVFHAGGPRCLSLYEIAQIVNRVGGYDPELLHGCYRLEAGPIPPRAGNVTMVSKKLARALGRDAFHDWPADGRFVPTCRRWHYDQSDWQGSPQRIIEELYQRPVID